MRRLCIYLSDGNCIAPYSTGAKFRKLIERHKLSQREVCRRMGIHPDRLCRLLKGDPLYRWSEKIARRIMKAIKK